MGGAGQDQRTKWSQGDHGEEAVLGDSLGSARGFLTMSVTTAQGVGIGNQHRQTPHNCILVSRGLFPVLYVTYAEICLNYDLGSFQPGKRDLPSL